MMRNSLFACTTAALLTLVGNSVSWADDTGFITIHELRREGRLYCTSSHTHVGTGTVQRTKRRATRSAAREWSEFTTWEYGSDWGRWRNARGKTVSCTGRRGAITCTVEARPCKVLRKRRRRRR